MCLGDPAQILHLRSVAAGNLGGGYHEFRDLDLSHWPDSTLWRVRCVVWHQFNELAVGMGGRNEPSLSLHLDGFARSANASSVPIAMALPDVNDTYRSTTAGHELVGSLAGRVLRFSTRDTRTGDALECDAWVAILECRPVV